MKKIGREVAFLATGAQNPRNGEGSFLRLLDGRIMYAYTEYYGDSWEDHATARISAVFSPDEGESWSQPSVLIEKDADTVNIMSVSLFRMKNGDVGCLYLRKFASEGGILCVPYFARSSDEGGTFGTPVRCIARDGYFVVNNDRLVRLKSGRLLFPTAYHGADLDHLTPGEIYVCYSDDDGASWNLSADAVRSPYEDNVRLQEPGLFALPDGRLWLYTRTAYGHQYQAFSTDDGLTFGRITPAFRFSSPDAPMHVKTVGALTLAIFNPIGYHPFEGKTELWGSPKRTPYVCAVSRDGGLSFVDGATTSANGGFQDFIASCYALEDDTEESYCYPAIIEVEGGFLVAYYHSNGADTCLNCNRITKVLYEEFNETKNCLP